MFGSLHLFLHPRGYHLCVSEGRNLEPHREIQALGSVLLGRRLTDLAYDLKVTFDILAEYRANLTHDAQELFEQWWTDQEKEIAALSTGEHHLKEFLSRREL